MFYFLGFSLYVAIQRHIQRYGKLVSIIGNMVILSKELNLTF